VGQRQPFCVASKMAATIDKSNGKTYSYIFYMLFKNKIVEDVGIFNTEGAHITYYHITGAGKILF
jgi:hypothetical protein